VTFDAWSSTLSTATQAFSIGSGATGTTFTIDTLGGYTYIPEGTGSALAAFATGVIDDDGTGLYR